MTACDAQQASARRELCRTLIDRRDIEATRPLVRQEILDGDAGLEWCTDQITRLFKESAFTAACDLAKIIAELRWASAWYSQPGAPIPDESRARRFLTPQKLRHDMEQFEYLGHRGLLGGLDLRAVTEAYDRIATRLESEGTQHQVPLSPEDEAAIGATYNRFLHIRETPRVARALSGQWDAETAARDYGQRPGVVVLDQFLSQEALHELRAFCLESTVWTANRYGHGRLGAFFHDGFCCRLLVQIAEELQRALPTIVGEYPLRQVWAFKNTAALPAGSTLHADFAAVNVNFWITPEEANLDRDSGGLDIYDINAPLWWDFASYNARADLIRTLLTDRRATVRRIPYRANRAVIFNSDLFHATQEVRFAPGYGNHRINVTFLFGDRENDRHHPQLAAPTVEQSGNGSTAAWRSSAFRR